MDYFNRTARLLLGLPVVLLMLAGTSNAEVAAEDTSRVSISTEGVASDRSALVQAEPSRDEYKALVVGGNRNKPTNNAKASASGQRKTSGGESRTPNTDFWFYTADVELFTDRDRDGYYAGIDLLFDADTYFDIAEVYAVIYLSYEYGPWNEYAETENFTILGTSGADEYIVETDLVEGYPTGNYDILIELYDAYDNALVATIGPEDTSELSILPLEDIGRDSPVETTQIVVNSGGGGSLSWLLLLGLAGVLARKR